MLHVYIYVGCVHLYMCRYWHASDSPIGLASWLSEKYHAWSDLHEVQGDLNKIFSYDEILDFIMIYWISGEEK